MTMRSHIAYYNATEIERMYAEHISDKVEVGETEAEKVTTSVYAWLMNLAGKADAEYKNEKVKELSDKTLHQAVKVVEEFLDERDDIPKIAEIPKTESNYYQFSGRATIKSESFHNADENDIVEVYGEDDGVQFYAYTSFMNWVDGDSNSLLLHASDSNGIEQNITGLLYSLGDSPDDRGYPVKFTAIYI